MKSTNQTQQFQVIVLSNISHSSVNRLPPITPSVTAQKLENVIEKTKYFSMHQNTNVSLHTSQTNKHICCLKKYARLILLVKIV